MATLVEILAKNWKCWPAPQVEEVWQNVGGYVRCRELGVLCLMECSTDAEPVTRQQWEAERARQELAAIACGKRSKEDQELWDKVAATSLQSLMPITWELSDKYDSGNQLVKCQVETACDYADAFITERAKRMENNQ